MVRAWRPQRPRTERLSSYNPATGELDRHACRSTARPRSTPRSRARASRRTRWGALSFAARGEELTAFRKALAAHADELADLLHRENGKPELEALTEVMMALGHLQHATACAEAAMAPRRVSAGHARELPRDDQLSPARRDRRDRPVELPAVHADGLDRVRARRRQRGRVEAERADAAGRGQGRRDRGAARSRCPICCRS